MAKGHTYEKWQELGYQVKKGQKAAYRFYGNNIFTRDQVVNTDNADEESEYHNHCFNCQNDVDSSSEDQCDECDWLICSNCHSCGCDYK